MKLKCYLLALVGYALAVVSCNKESDVTPNGTEPVAVESVNVELEATADETIQVYTADGEKESLRIAQELNTDRSIKAPILREKDLEIRVSVRRGTTGTGLEQTLVFKKVPGQNKVRFSGQIQVPQGSGKPQIAAIVLKEVNGETFGVLKGDGTVEPSGSSHLWGVGNVNKKSAVPSRIIYTANWTDIPLTNGKITEELVPIHFKPSGSLLRVRIFNSSNTEKRTLKAIKVCSNAFVTNWAYNFGELGKSDGKILDGVAKGDAGTMASHNWTLPSPVLQNPVTHSGWYYFYVMPVAEAAVQYPYTEIKVIADVNGVEKTYYGWASDYRFKQGATPMDLRMVEPTPGLAFGSHFPEQRIPVYHLPRTEDGYVKILSGKQAPYKLIDPRQFKENTDEYSEEAVRALEGVTLNIGGANYKIPTFEEMSNVSPKHRIWEEKFQVSFIKGTGEIKEFFSNKYTIPNNRQEPETPLYGHMYRDGANRHLVGIHRVGVGNYVKATYRYLGACFTDTYGEKVSNPEFWATPWPTDLVLYFKVGKPYATSTPDIAENGYRYRWELTTSLRKAPSANSSVLRRVPRQYLDLRSSSSSSYLLMPFPSN